MSIPCPEEIFEEFRNGIGKWVRLSRDACGFVYGEGLSEIDFLDVLSLNTLELYESTFSDWDSLTDWCESVTAGLDLLSVVDQDSEEFDQAYNDGRPSDYFGTIQDLKNRILKHLTDDGSDRYETMVAFFEVEHQGQKLYVILTELDGWSLGHLDTVVVVENLDQLTPELGFYDSV